MVDLWVVGAAVGVVVVLAVVVLLLSKKRKKAYIFHVGAVMENPTHFEGQRFMLYGFIDPVYGKSVRIRGLGGVIKGRSSILPAGGSVMEGTFKDGAFGVERMIKQLPGNLDIAWVEPAASRKKKEPVEGPLKQG